MTLSLVLVACGSIAATRAQDSPKTALQNEGQSADLQSKRSTPPLLVGNVFPHMTVMAPEVGSDTEAGIGALIPWADRLWAIGYVAHTRGNGLGLYEIGEDFSFKRHPASVTGTYANRMVHWESRQAFIGPYAIDAEGNVRTIDDLTNHRLTATARHLTHPAEQVYVLTMQGILFEVDVTTLEAEQLFDLTEVLELPANAQPHFKGAHAAQGRLVVANNTYEEPDFLGHRSGGRLAEWDGETWTILEENPFVTVSGKQNSTDRDRFGNTLYAVGWDRASVIFRVLHDGKWSRYRLPKGSHSWDHAWNTEWMRIREVQTERYLMDAFGIFYELPGLVYGGHVWGIRPISTHLRICPDMVYWRGLLVLAGDQTDQVVGQPQSGLWFGDIDDLWAWGKPSGWGAVWWETELETNEVSDPFLMTGFDKKVLHLTNHGEQPNEFVVEIDYLGTGAWNEYQSIRVPAGGYTHHEFPDAFNAHWVRLRSKNDGRATASFYYN